MQPADALCAAVRQVALATGLIITIITAAIVLEKELPS